MTAASPGPISALIAQAAADAPSRLVMRDQPGRASWSGRAPRAYDGQGALAEVDRLTRHFRRLGLAPGTRVGVFLPGGTEACLTLAALPEADLSPCLLPLAAPRAELAAALAAADVTAVVSQTRLGDLRPAELFCHLAAEWMPLRFLLAFGPAVPDGVLDLDRPDPGGHARTTRSAGASDVVFVTFARCGGSGLTPTGRSVPALLAAAASTLQTVSLRAGDVLASWIAPDDLKGLATGFLPALAAGATFEAHGLFDAADATDLLARHPAAHLVLPSWSEALARDLSGGAEAASLVVVHDAPADLAERPFPDARTADAVALGEDAVFVVPRGRGVIPDRCPDRGSSPGLLDFWLDETDEIHLRGLAACSAPLREAASPDPAVWRPSGYRARIGGGRLLGVA